MSTQQQGNQQPSISLSEYLERLMKGPYSIQVLPCKLNTVILKEIGSLSEYQKTLAKEYYYIQVLPNTFDAKTEERLYSILETAENNPVLSRYLELIDEILEPPQELTDKEKNDRAFLAEYLVLSIQEKGRGDLHIGEDPDVASEEPTTCSPSYGELLARQLLSGGFNTQEDEKKTEEYLADYFI
jgi:hypothetical protein